MEGTRSMDGLHLQQLTTPGTIVHCPAGQCDFEYMAPIRVVVNAGGAITTIDEHGTRMRTGPAAGRGVMITTTFTCENGHYCDLEMHFHKGMTLVEARVLGYAPGALHTIWRD